MNKTKSTTKIFLSILALTISTANAAEKSPFDTFKEHIKHPTKTDKIYAGTFAFNSLIFVGKKIRSKPLIFIPAYILFSLLCANSIIKEEKPSNYWKT